MHKVDVYDFDGTIYDGDSSIDFLFYSLKKKKSIVKYFSKIFIYMILKTLKLVSLERFKEIYFSFTKEIKNLDKFVNDFWKEKESKINYFFIENVKNTEEIYVISASPEFLLKPYISQFKNVKLIATKFDENGKIIGKNCKGEQKVKLLQKQAKDIIIENFYTDSLNDLPLVNISKKSYLVHNKKVEDWNTEKIKKKKINKK